MKSYWNALSRAAQTAALMTVVLLASAGAGFADQKSSGDLDHQVNDNQQRGQQFTIVDVIVQFKVVPSAKDVKKMMESLGLDWNDDQKSKFDRIGAVHLKVPSFLIKTLTANPLVRYVTPNRPTKGSLDVVTSSVFADLAWASSLDGSGIGVAVIDSGVAFKDDLKNPSGLASRVVYSESFVSGLTAADQYGHGTHVAGIIGSSGRDSLGLGFTRTFRGVAPNVNIINLRVLDANGAGSEADVIAAIHRVIDLKNTYNIRVMNLSLGRPVFESYLLDPLCQAVEAAYRAGIVVVVAAGNYGRDNSRGTHGYGTIASPGNDPYVITVGAINAKGTKIRADDSIASYSSKGPTAFDHIVKPDLVAPGNNVVSLMAPSCTLAKSYPKTLLNKAAYETLGIAGQSGEYFKLSGTSMATPVVSGAVALLLQKDPSLTPDQVKARLMKTAGKVLPLYSNGVDAFNGSTYSNQSDIFTVGAGYLDISAALANSDRVTLPAQSPVAVFDSVSHKVSILRNMSVIWGDSVVWGDSILWGTFVFNGKLGSNSIIWGDSVIWGDSTTAGFSVVWGDSTPLAMSLQALAADDGDQ